MAHYGTPLTAFVLSLISAIAVPGSADNTKPNILVILSDDQGWGDLSLNGNKDLKTPHIDSLAKDGARFDRFYVCPVCSPTRAEFLTGRYHPRGGVYSTSAGGERLDLDETTIADVFRAAGYVTGAFGKWHNGMQYPYHPNGRGFEEYYGFCSGHWGNYFSPPLEHNGRIVQGDGFIIDDLTNKAIEFIEHSKDHPFFAYLPLNTPHSPMQVPDRWWDKFKDKKLAMAHGDASNHTRAALAMCENIDWNVGRILKKLDQMKIANHTIVVYFCDNGPNGARWNGGMKGRKGSTDEGGVRSPLLIRWPGVIQAGRNVTQISAAIDLLPTLAALAGVKVPNKPTLDGISLKPLLVGDPAAKWPDRMIFSHWSRRVSVRTQRYRLDNKGKLFDMIEDPGQSSDISKRQPQVAARLKQAVEGWRAELLPQLQKNERPFVVGHPDFKYTQIPARDGTAHGNIKRSNRFPNCSFFSNWTSVDDAITWDVEVGARGRYEVEIHYACRDSDVGSAVELSLGDHRLRGKITVAHDPPLRGGEHDRIERRESYVKDFRSLRLGTITLPKGRGELALRALDIPGEQVMDFRLLMLTRIEEADGKNTDESANH